jgi:hypothetical protein
MKRTVISNSYKKYVSGIWIPILCAKYSLLFESFFFEDQAVEDYIKSLHEKSKRLNVNQAIVTEHEVRDPQGNTLPKAILYSRTMECRTKLNLPFVKTLSKGKYN